MPKKGYTAILVVLDNSGSMSDIARTVEDSLAQVAREQAALPGDCTFDLVRFSSEVHYEQQNVAAKDFRPRLSPSGMTALYDAIVFGVTWFRERLDDLDDADKPEFVQIVVATDGEENSSTAVDALLVRDTVAMHTQAYGWDFTFIGANQDAIMAGALLGFEGKKSMTFNATDAGVKGAASGLAAYIAQTRAGQDAGYSDADRDAAMAH